MNALNLQEFNILKQEENAYDYLFTVECVDEPVVCPKCLMVKQEGEVAFKRHATRDRVVTDLSMHTKRVKIKVLHRRFKCLHCGFTFFEQINSVDSHDKITKRLWEHLKQKSVQKPFTQIADEFGISNMTVRRAFDEFVTENEKDKILIAPKIIGIDEAHLNKVMRGVITDVEGKRILEILENNSKKSVKDCIKSMEGYRNIEVATMDMHPPYRYAINELVPNALCIIDKYHVIQMATKALNKVRVDFKNSISKELKNRLLKDRWVLLSNKEDLKPEDIIRRDAWFEQFPTLRIAYWLKEDLRDIYTAPDRYNAFQMFYQWECSIPNSMPLFKEVAEAINRCKQEVFNYFLRPYTNAYTESANNLIKRIEKAGVGYSFEVLRAKVLYGTAATVKPKYGEMPFLEIKDRHLSLIGLDNYADDTEEYQRPKKLLEGFGVDMSHLDSIFEQGNF